MRFFNSLVARLSQLKSVTQSQLIPFAQLWVARLRHPTKRGVLIAIAIPPVLLLAYTLVLLPFTPSISDIRKANTEHPAQIYFADGKKLTEFKQSNREWVDLKDISPYVVEALIATEDHRFYEHHGMDFKRTASAMLRTFSGDRQGGSTITQQLARNLYPDGIGRAPTLTRKLKEAITAFKIEAVHSKPEILETYLNTVPFLYNAFGIEMAARTYFDTSADKLDILQSATLVGMLKGNSYYNPVINPERAISRRNTVLAQMVKRGKLDEARFEALKKKPLRLDFERQNEEPGPAPHFAQQLRKWLITWADQHDYNIYSDGLIIRTTLDSRLQGAANRALAKQGNTLQGIANSNWGSRAAWEGNRQLIEGFIKESSEYQSARKSGASDEQALKQLRADAGFMRKLRQDKTRIQAGFLALDPNNGAVKAWVGSRDFLTDAYDHVAQARRQPGSTFKPFVYGEAFRQGMSPDDTFIDEAVEIPVGDNEIWKPTDAEPPTGKPMKLRDALAHSKNTVTAQVMQKVTPAKVVRLAKAMGVKQSKLEALPSLALGTSPVTLKEMTTAYGTIANGGSYREPYFVTRIEDREGNVLADFSPTEPEPALNREVSYTLLDVMRGVIDRGTGAGIRSRYGIRADVAGKTGTTQDNTDGWFILMHPQLVAGAWVGFNDSRITLRSDYWGQGAHSALPIVGEFMRSALHAKVINAKAKFEAPDESNFITRFFRWAYESIKEWILSFFKADTPTRVAPVAESPTIAPPDDLTEPPDSPSAPAASPANDPLGQKIDEIMEKENTETQTAPSNDYTGAN